MFSVLVGDFAKAVLLLMEWKNSFLHFPSFLIDCSKADNISKLANPEEYKAGDIVCWNLGGTITHIGIVSNKKSVDSGTPLVVHNIGAGQVEEDCLFKYYIIGHSRNKKRGCQKKRSFAFFKLFPDSLLAMV